MSEPLDRSQLDETFKPFIQQAKEVEEEVRRENREKVERFVERLSDSLDNASGNRHLRDVYKEMEEKGYIQRPKDS
jgi:hypothetical protein